MTYIQSPSHYPFHWIGYFQLYMCKDDLFLPMIINVILTWCRFRTLFCYLVLKITLSHEIYDFFLCYSGIFPAQIFSAVCSRNSVPCARLVASFDFRIFVECQHRFAWAKDPLRRHMYAGATRTNPLPWPVTEKRTNPLPWPVTEN